MAKPQMISTDEFTTFRKADRTLVFMTEISTLGAERPFGYLADGRVGFEMRSAKTGTRVEYVLTQTERRADEGILAWHFNPTARAAKATPACAKTQVLIFND